VILIIIAVLILYPAISQLITDFLIPSDGGVARVDTYKDLNETHLKYAKLNGIQGFKTNKGFRDNLDRLIEDGKLVHIENTKYYVIKKLTHSHPYLTPKAGLLLEEIGKRFHRQLSENDLKKYRYQVSSLLRTGETQRSLSRSNVNASSNTSHLYGTTFDISYKHVNRKILPGYSVAVSDAKAIRTLSKVLGELRKEGKCVIVTERKEACFHITAR
jgi:hypothetical protein